jgi:hypothetical protein
MGRGSYPRTKYGNTCQRFCIPRSSIKRTKTRCNGKVTYVPPSKQRNQSEDREVEKNLQFT